MNDVEKLVEQLLFGVTSWNQWRQDNPNQARLDLNHVNLSGANLRGADLSEVDLTEADLSGANLSNAKLYAANLSGADLSQTIMPYADLRRANLRNANLMGADFSSTYRTADVDLRGAKYNQDTILPYMSWSQKQTLIFVDSSVESDKEEEIIDLSVLTDERKRINSERVSREDQPKFRELLKDAYQGKCAISQCDVERVIEAAHIFPYRGPQTDCLWNGIWLRLDIHRLFDSYLLTIDAQDYQVRLSPNLMNSCYREYAEKSVCFPEQPISKNRKQVLQWHNAQCSWWKSTRQLGSL